MSVVEAAPAKINLHLHVAAPRTDGYHDLHSYVAFADVGDRLTAARSSDGLALVVDGPFGGVLKGEAAETNLVWRAAMALADLCGVTPDAALRLEKHLPVASGVGGGSSDAAAALRALIALWDLDPSPESLAELALELGADVPVCLAARPAIMRGVGERLSPAPRIDAGLVLANPGVATPTGVIFKTYDAAGVFPAIEVPDAIGSPDSIGSDQTLDAVALAEHMARTRNDLEAPARGLVPQIGETLAALCALDGVRAARMCGSGATCFAIFDDREAAGRAAAVLRADRPDWWVESGAFSP